MSLPDIVPVDKAMKQNLSKTAMAVETKYNELGQQGWEYCGEHNGAVVFKRQRP